MIRSFRQEQGIKRAALAADANMSEKTLERAEGGQGISEDSCRRIARALGLQEDVFVGEKAGMGQTMKLCNNMLSATAMAASCEMMVMGVKAGLDPAVMVDVINAGSGANTAVRDKFPKSIMTGGFDYGFYTGLMYKDVRVCMEEGEALGVPLPVSSAVHQMWVMANQVNGAGSDFTEIVKIIEGWAGVEVRNKKK